MTARKGPVTITPQHGRGMQQHSSTRGFVTKTGLTPGLLMVHLHEQPSLALTAVNMWCCTYE